VGGALTQLTFEDWLAHVFDHSVRASGQEWYWDLDADWWGGAAADTVEFLTRAFEGAAAVLRPYSDAQLNQGLWYIASNACSDHMFALMDADVPWPARQRCIRSVHALFAQCFAKRCTPHLSHLPETEPGASPLNLVCYMWWDIIPIGPQPDDPTRTDLDREILAVIEETLQLDSIACQESALHGLGHWKSYYPQRVEEIIGKFLQSHPRIREELRTYALSAFRGCVL
jgi:hypothetical protein